MVNQDNIEGIKDLLDQKYKQFNRSNFIESDPITIPHRFSKKEDIEIAGFFAATLAWGNRKSIIQNCLQLLERMDNEPHQFVLDHTIKDLNTLNGFVHRTFNANDAKFFVRALRNIYKNHKGLEHVFAIDPEQTLTESIVKFRTIFLQTQHEKRSEKHLSDPANNSSSKRLCMYLRWMVRQDKSGVDFGIWKRIKPSQLMLPLDVHTGFVSRELSLLKRKQNDWKAVEEITHVLRSFDPHDPVKYDFALFGLGIEGYFKS